MITIKNFMAFAGVNRLRDRYGLSSGYSKPMKEKLKYYNITEV